MCTLQYNTALLATPLTSGTDLSTPEFKPEKDILNNDFETN